MLFDEVFSETICGVDELEIDTFLGLPKKLIEGEFFFTVSNVEQGY